MKKGGWEILIINFDAPDAQPGDKVEGERADLTQGFIDKLLLLVKEYQGKSGLEIEVIDSLGEKLE